MPELQREGEGAREDVIGVVVRYFARPEYLLLPKHVRLHRAFFDAITRGEIKPHIQIPAEVEVARQVGVSLGTAQRALGRLAEDGLLNRRQGHGTFVAERQIPEEELWQFRFLPDPSGETYLPVFAKLRKLREERSYGRWSKALGDDPAGFVFIERLITGKDATLCLSRIYLPASRFGGVMSGSLIGLNPINIKLMLRKEYGAQTTSTQQVIRFIRLNREEAELLGQREDAAAIQLEATGFDQNALPISYHEVVIPPSDWLLDISYSGRPARAHPR